MDPATVIVVLAAHLLCSGGLLFLIGRRMPPRCGILLWAAGLALFGAAYVARLVTGLNAQQTAWTPLFDTAMIGAALLFVAGLRDFTGRAPLTRGNGAWLLLIFVALQLGAMALFGATGRHVVLNAGLGAVYGWLALSAVAVRHEVETALRRPLLVTTALMGLLAVLTLARGAQFVRHGSGDMYRGVFAQFYYGYASLAAVLLAMCLLWMVFARLNGQLAELATRDALTRVLNRTGLDDVLARHFGARNAKPLTLLALDIDHFKRINDTLGHASGDLVLRAVAGALASHVRPNDVVARVGGEEFIVCCPATDAATALSLAERLREAVAALATTATDGRTVARCTVSIGVAQPFAALAAWPRAAAEADAALYAAKAAGRNRVLAA